jgi:hypothetical protein
MSSVLTKHTAGGQMVGYLWQLERALISLLRAPSGAKVGVEALDDVALVDAKTGEVLGLEQDKSTVGPLNNLGDGSKNLWKTLCIWAGAAKNGEVDLEKVYLYLVTPIKVPQGLARLISDARTKEQATGVLSVLHGTVVADGTIPYKTELLGHSVDLLTKLVMAVDLIDGDDQYVTGGFEEALNHHYGFNDTEKSKQIAYSLLGWFLRRTITEIRAGQPAWTERTVFFSELNGQVERLSYRRALEVIEFVLQDSDVSAHRSSLFVKQLELIDAEQDEIVEAISDYLKVKALRVKWGRNSRVSREELKVFDDSLLIRWKTIFRRLSAQGAGGKVGEVATGKQIYYATIDHREPLGGQATEQYFTTRGRYHALANDLRKKLGWHPKFEELLLRFLNSGGDRDADD